MPPLAVDAVDAAATPTIPPAYLELAYPLPRENRSLEDHHRAQHHDLPGLTDEDLALEGFRVLLRMCFERDPDAMTWLRERRLTVRAERVRRRELQPPPFPARPARSDALRATAWLVGSGCREPNSPPARSSLALVEVPLGGDGPRRPTGRRRGGGPDPDTC